MDKNVGEWSVLQQKTSYQQKLNSYGLPPLGGELHFTNCTIEEECNIIRYPNEIFACLSCGENREIQIAQEREHKMEDELPVRNGKMNTKHISCRREYKVLRTIGNFPRRTPVRDLHMAFKFPHIYIYNYITKLCRQQAEVIQNHENANVRNTGQGEPRHRKYKRFKLGGSKLYDRSSD
jgi:hypothetical protein